MENKDNVSLNQDEMIELAINILLRANMTITATDSDKGVYKNERFN